MFLMSRRQQRGQGEACDRADLEESDAEIQFATHRLLDHLDELGDRHGMILLERLLIAADRRELAGIKPLEEAR